jgi:hypothetical protein
MADNKQSAEDYGKEMSKAISFGTDEWIGAVGQMIEAGNELTKAFSQSRARVSEMMSAVNEAAPRMRRLGANFQQTLEVMKDIAVATGKNTLASADSVAKLYATTKAIGGDVGNIVKSFESVGIQFGVIGGQLEEATMNVRDLGLNAREVMTDVVNNASALNKFNFDGGVQGLSKMAARAAQLKSDMRTTLDFADRMMNPENAIEMASAFQRLGVTAGNLVDPFALMNQSINDPGALQESISKISKQYTYFDEKTKSFRINPQGMLTLRQLATETNMSYESLTKTGLAAAELDKRLSQISPSITFKDESDKQFLSNLAEMDSTGNYVVKINDQQTKNLADVTQEEFNKLITEQKNQPKTMEEIARAGMTTSEVIKNDVAAIKGAIIRGAVGTSVVKDNLEAFRKITTTPTGILSDKVGRTEIFNKQFETVSNSIRDAAKELVKTDGKSMGDVMKDLGTKFGKQGDEVKKIVEQLGISVYKDIKGKDVSYRSSEIGDLANKALRGLESYVDKTDFGKKAATTTGTKSGVTVKPASGKSALLEGTDEFTNVTSKDKTLTSTVNQTVDYSGTITFKVDAPPGVSTQYLTDFLNSEKFKEQIYNYVQEKNRQKEKTK